MAVLIEGLAVVIRRPSIDSKYQGGPNAFLSDVPSRSYCDDAELARIGFMHPDDVRSYVSTLEAKGLQYQTDRKSVDLVVVDQRTGPLMQCEWLEFGFTHWGGDQAKPISVCRAKPTAVSKIVAPQGWKFEGSLSAIHSFVPTDMKNPSLKFLRQEAGLSVYLDETSGKELYVGRTTTPDSPK